MHIGFFGVKDWEEQHLADEIAQEGLEGSVSFYQQHIDKDNLPQEKDFEVISVFVGSTIGAEVLDVLPYVKLIAARSTGYDHIDIRECKKRGVTVVTVPTYGENTVAEHAFALLLTLSKKIYESYDRVRESGSFSLDGLQGFDLKGKTLGVVGAGSIGRSVIRIANGFGMAVLAYDIQPDEQLTRELAFSYVPFDALLARSDVVTLHVPSLPATRHLIDEQAVQKMKKGAYLINTSRGEIVDTDALVAALTSGHLAGAGLDVLEEEGVIQDELAFVLGGHPQEHDLQTVMENHILIDLPNVIVTPHNAFNTKEALGRILDTTIKNINNFIAGNPTNVVTPHG